MTHRSVTQSLKFAAVTAIIPFMVACGENDDTATSQAQIDVPTSDAYSVSDISGCGQKQLEKALLLDGKTKNDLTEAEYAEELADTTASCQKAADEALALNSSAAPRFDSIEDCNAAGMGTCGPAPAQANNGTTTVIVHDSYSPLMNYMLMSQLMRHNVVTHQVVHTTPLYRTPQNNYVSPAGKVFNTDTVRHADTSAYSAPLKPAIVPKGTTFKAEVYTPPKSTYNTIASPTYTTPKSVPSAPAARTTTSGSSYNNASTNRPAPAVRSPSPSPSRGSFGGGGFGGGGRR